METKENTLRMTNCPSFERCNAPKCPLDEFIAERIRYPGETFCVASKKTRMELGKDLKYKGLTVQEYNGVKQSYGSLDSYCKRILEKTPIQTKDKNPKRMVDK